MRHELTIGVRAENIGTVTHAVHELTGWSFEPHNSSYLGEYDLFCAPEKVMVKYNFVDPEGEWDFPDHQHFAVLIVVGETDRPEFFYQVATKLGLQAEVISDKSW